LFSINLQNQQVAEILVQSLTIDMTPVPRKLARLYVISDILHNSSNSLPNAWKYRQTLEKLLPDVFDHLNLIYRSFPGRIKAETFKKQICLIVNVWNSFMVFGQNSIDDFNERLVKIDVDDADDQQAIDGEDVGIPLEDGEEDVDGVAAEDSLLWTAEESQAPSKSNFAWSMLTAMTLNSITSPQSCSFFFVVTQMFKAPQSWINLRVLGPQALLKPLNPPLWSPANRLGISHPNLESS
jgi:hypothetical protein